MPLDIEECRTALWIAKGNVTKAAEVLKISSNRLRQFINNSPRLTNELRETREQILDKAEEVIVEALEQDDDVQRKDSMARFALTNLGANRGYGNGKGGVSINLPKTGKIEISWADGTSINDQIPEDGVDIIDVIPEAAE